MKAGRSIVTMRRAVRRSVFGLGGAAPIRLSLLAGVMLGLAGTAQAEEPLGGALSLPQAIAVAQRDNKDLKTARYAVDVAQARLLQAGVLPNPRLNITGASDFAFKNSGEYTASVGVSQDFPIAGRILRQKDVARIDIDLAYAEIAEAERRLAGEITASVYRVLAVDRQVQAREELAAIDERLAKATRSRFHAAEVSELDVNTVALDLQRLRQEQVQLQAERIRLLLTLNQLLGRPSGAALMIREPLPSMDTLSSLAEQQAKALASRPDLRLAQLQIERAQADMALAKSKRWEDWSVGLGVQQDRIAVDGAPSQSADRALSFNLTIPLSLKNRTRGLIAEAEASAEQAKARVEARQLDISNQVATAYSEASTLQGLYNGYQKDLLPVTARNVALAQKGYSQGLVSLVEVVQAQRQQADFNTASVNALDQYLQALARLRTAVGDYPVSDIEAGHEPQDSHQ